MSDEVRTLILQPVVDVGAKCLRELNSPAKKPEKEIEILVNCTWQRNTPLLIYKQALYLDTIYYILCILYAIY